MILKATNC